jgi:uncharacterized oxidoreductase
MSADHIVIHPQALTDYIAAIVTAAGSSAQEAVLVAANLVLANLSGHDSHGVGMMSWYVKYIATGGLAINRHATLTGEAGAMLMFNGHKGYGQVIGHEAMQYGITRARQHGMALVALRNSHHLGRIGQWAEDCAGAGLVSIHFVNALLWPLVAPYAGSDARFATNPFCVGVPRRGAAPIILDFATTKLALGKVRVAMQSEKEVPTGTLIDSSGNPTTNPRVMFEADAAGKLGAMLPFGEHKGFGMALICEILGGALTGGETMHDTGHMNGIHNNMLSIIIDPDRLGKANFHHEMEAFISWIRHSPLAPGYDKLRISGEPELEKRVQRAEGIPIDVNTWDEIKTCAAQAGMGQADIARHVGFARPTDR